MSNDQPTENPSNRVDRTTLFATVTVAAAALAFVVVLGMVLFGSGDTNPSIAETGTEGAEPVDLDDGAVADPDVDVDTLVADTASAMAEVTSVQFELERSGAPVFIDQFGELALDSLIGQFTVPTQAQAELTITVDDNLTTKIGAVAIDSEVWISNPVTGDFETLPAGYDIDPSRFFDPENGWQPLIAALTDVELVEIDDRGGERYHIRGTASADDVRNITVDLVRDQDVVVDFWIHPTSSLVTAAEFTTLIDEEETEWVLDLSDYGQTFTIKPPENVRTETTSG